jgi:hypothetical protein
MFAMAAAVLACLIGAAFGAETTDGAPRVLRKKSPAPRGAAPAASRSEMEQLRGELRELRNYVKLLESKIEGGAAARPAARPEASPKGPLAASSRLPAASSGDPLADIEGQLGYRGGQPIGGVAAPAQPRAAPAPAAGADPLAAVERDLAFAKSTPSSLANPRTAFNPQISVIGDFVYRNSNIDEDPAAVDANGAARGDANRDRFSMRELEVTFQATIDPFSRADIFLSMPGVLEEFENDAAAANEQKIELEEAFISYWRLPWGMQLKGGKFRMEVGKNNLQHGHALYGIERPDVIRNFLGGEGIREQGLSLQGQIPLDGPGTQLQLTGQIVNGEGGEETLFAGPGSDKTLGLARARLYHDISDSANIDVGYSHLWGHHDPAGRFRQRVRGVDVTFRYEPVSSNVYKQLILRAEYLRGDRNVPVDLPIDRPVDVNGDGIPDDVDGDGIPDGDAIDDTAEDFVAHQQPDGFYVMAQYQWDRYWNVGYRYDETNPALRMAELATDPDPAVRDRANLTVDHLHANTLYLTYLTSEFNQWRLEYQNRGTNFPLDNDQRSENTISAQWIFAMGPHGAHKY